MFYVGLRLFSDNFYYQDTILIAMSIFSLSLSLSLSLSHIPCPFNNKEIIFNFKVFNR